MDKIKNMKKSTKIIALVAVCIAVFGTLGVVLVKAKEKEDLAAVAEIQESIDALFTDENKEMLSATISQDIIDGIYASIDELSDDISKNAEDELEAAKTDLDAAQSLLTMEVAVAELFDEQGVVKADADVAGVEAELANFKETYPKFFEEQQAYVEKAKSQQNEIATVTEAMNSLFTDATRTEVRDDVTREEYESVLSQVEAMTIVTVQSQFTEQLKAVEAEVLENEAEAEAKARAEAEQKAKEEAEAKKKAEEEAAQKELDSLSVKTGDSPYFLHVDKSEHLMTVYSKDENGNYTNKYKKFSVATGSSPSMTPLGTFTLGEQEDWHEWAAGTYSPYAYTFAPGLYIHGPIYTEKDFDTVIQKSVNEIGTNATSGCIRMYTSDAKWIYQNCPPGTKIQIVN